MIAAPFIVALIAGSFLLQVLALRLGLRWAKVPGVSVWRAVRLTLVLLVASLFLSSVLNGLLARIELTPLGAVLLPLGVAAVVSVAEWLLLAVLLRVRFRKAAPIWLTMFAATIVSLTFLYLVFKPFVVDAFVQTSHAMAPTLLGPHVQGTCPHCGGPATAAVEPNLPPGERIDTFGICSACQQTGVMTDPPQVKMPLMAGDRFAVCKFLPPARWDVVTINTPDPQPLLVTRRVVGLPGEEIVIRDGSVWANGVKLEPPYDIAKLKLTTAPDHTPDGFGSPDNPTRLGPDEYFVLGDFSRRSIDSRTWGPVPRKDITGVVSFIYFPFNRVRLLK